MMTRRRCRLPKQGASLQDKAQLKERLEAVPRVAAVTHCRYQGVSATILACGVVTHARKPSVVGWEWLPPFGLPVRGAGRMMPRVSTPLRLLVAAAVLVTVFFSLAAGTIPTRVSFGAGSLRCGAALDTLGWDQQRGDAADQEFAHACAKAARQRLRDASVAAAIVAAVALLPLALSRLVDRSRAVRYLVTGIVLAYWLLTLPLVLYWMAGAD
jgi:hypothetical protein